MLCLKVPFLPITFYITIKDKTMISLNPSYKIMIKSYTTIFFYFMAFLNRHPQRYHKFQSASEFLCVI
jgi:hypothetical protein